MSLTFKLLSLAVRTAAKPIGNYIKRQAKEHEGFRRFAINRAQWVHRIDMRMRLGILHDPEAQQRMHEREQRAAEEKKRRVESPTVRSELEQKAHDEQQARDKAQAEAGDDGKKEEKKRIKIRPLSDSRAIELGANFFSEAFIFAVAVALLLTENYRSRSKENARRDEVAERLEALEAQVERLSTQHHLPELEALNEKIKRAREARSRKSWYNPTGWIGGSDVLGKDDDDEGIPGEVEHLQAGQKSGPTNSTAAVPAEPTAKAKDVAKVAKDGKATTPPEATAAKQLERFETVNAGSRGR